MDTFIFKETPTFKEYLGMFYYQTFRKRMIKRIFIFINIVSLLHVVLELISEPNMKWYMIIFNLLFVPVFLVVFLYVTGFLITIFLWYLKPMFFKNVTTQFTHWGMEKTGEGFHITMPWSKFLKYKETKKFILLYITIDDAVIIQKKVFDSNKQLEDFRNLVSEKIGVG